MDREKLLWTAVYAALDRKVIAELQYSISPTIRNKRFVNDAENELQAAKNRLSLHVRLGVYDVRRNNHRNRNVL